MLSRVLRLVPSLVLVALVQAVPATAQTPAAAAGPVIVVETSRGVFEFETYPAEAPKTVARIVELVKQRFYNGMRVHRVVPGFVIQWGDPQTRDMTKKDRWVRAAAESRSAWPRSPRPARTCWARWPWRMPVIPPRPIVRCT